LALLTIKIVSKFSAKKGIGVIRFAYYIEGVNKIELKILATQNGFLLDKTI